MQRRTPNTVGVIPLTVPPWIHRATSRTSLAGLEIGLPPSPSPFSAEDSSMERAPSGLDKPLPPPPRPPRENITIQRPSPNPFLTIPEASAPDIPRKNPRRFSWVSSGVSSTAGVPLRTLRRTSSSIHSPTSITTSASAGVPPAAARPPSDRQKDSSAPEPLDPKHQRPLLCQTNKVAQLTGCDLSSDRSPSQLPPRFESNASISSSLYSDSDDVSPTTLKSCKRRHSDDSLSSIVDSYSDWGSWAPSKEDFTSPLSSPQFPQHPVGNMHSVLPQDIGSTRTIASQSNTRTPVPPPAPPIKNRTTQLGTPEVVNKRTSYMKGGMQPPTLEHLIEQERNHLQNRFEDDPPLSPLAQVAALQLRRDSAFDHTGEVRVGRSAVRPQASMPSMPNHYRPQHARSVSRFSEGSSDEDEDARSVRSVRSARIRQSARGVRDSFVRGLSGLNRPSSHNNRPSSRLSQVTDKETMATSQRTSDTSATTSSPAATHKSHIRNNLSSSTANSMAISVQGSPITRTISQKSKARDSGFTRSWGAAAAAFKKPLRSSYFGNRPESGLGTGKSKSHSRMVSAPAASKIYGEGISQFPIMPSSLRSSDRQASPRASGPTRRAWPPSSPGMTGLSPGAIDLCEEQKQNLALLPEEIIKALKIKNQNTTIESDGIDPFQKGAVVVNDRQFSITGKAGKILGTVDTTFLPLPLAMSLSDNPVKNLGHVKDRQEEVEGENAKRGSLGRGFSVTAMMDEWKAKAGFRSKDEKRREQLKGLIRVIERDEKERDTSKTPWTRTPVMSQRLVPVQKLAGNKVKTKHMELKAEEKSEVKPGLEDDEMSRATQMWL